jgi:hypothetical protein
VPDSQSRISFGASKSGDRVSIAIPPELESKIRYRAETEGLSVEAYLERLIRADQQGSEELESLALEGLNSGTPINVGSSYWQEKHLRLDERLRKTGAR